MSCILQLGYIKCILDVYLVTYYPQVLLSKVDCIVQINMGNKPIDLIQFPQCCHILLPVINLTTFKSKNDQVWHFVSNNSSKSESALGFRWYHSLMQIVWAHPNENNGATRYKNLLM